MRKHGAAVRPRRTDTSIGVDNKFRYIYVRAGTPLLTYYRKSPRSIVERILRVWPVEILKCAS